MFKMRFHNPSTSDFINVEFMDMILPDGKLLNSEFLNGKNISLSNRKAVSKHFMESWPMGSKQILSKVLIQFLHGMTQQHIVNLRRFICASKID